MVVAILFCFMNSEVIGQLKRFLNMSMGGANQHRQSIAMTQYTVIKILFANLNILKVRSKGNQIFRKTLIAVLLQSFSTYVKFKKEVLMKTFIFFCAKWQIT